MTESSELTECQNTTLQKIGRNVVNFQKMEGMLKYLNANSTINGPVSDFENIRKRISGSIAKQPMGRLADTFIRTVYSNREDSKEKEVSSEEAHLSFTFSIEEGEEIEEARRSAISEIVANRNNLIHKWLIDFNPHSIESCRELSAKLDAQREKLIPEFEILTSMVKTLKDCISAHREYLDSEQFIIDFQKAQTGA